MKYKVFRSDGAPLSGELIRSYDIKLMKNANTFVYIFNAKDVHEVMEFANQCMKITVSGCWEEGVIFTDKSIEILEVKNSEEENE